MDSSDDKNQGELSLLEMMKCIESPANTNGDVTVPSALNVIELNEEKGRRQVFYSLSSLTILFVFNVLKKF